MLFSIHNLRDITDNNFLLHERHFNKISKDEKEIKLLEKVLQIPSFETFIEELNKRY